MAPALFSQMEQFRLSLAISEKVVRSMDQNEAVLFVITSFYHFVKIDEPVKLQKACIKFMLENQLKGTMLVATEGLNATVAGQPESIDALHDWLHQDIRFTHLKYKKSYSKTMPFLRAKVKLKAEIVTLGHPDLDPGSQAGNYVKPEDWNQLIQSPEVTLVDTRNDYEVQIGTFQNAINPNTASFREFPKFAKTELDPKIHKKVAMFCTGGIRCEKSTAYLNSLGFEAVYHLDGGILQYLEDIPESESLWQGECFVFDERVAVNHRLQPGGYQQCHACRLPLNEADLRNTDYVKGVSCPHCVSKTTEAQRARFLEREKQVQLANARGQTHIGSEAKIHQQQNRKTKQKLKSQQP